jgi:hypothetical protein
MSWRSRGSELVACEAAAARAALTRRLILLGATGAEPGGTGAERANAPDAGLPVLGAEDEVGVVEVSAATATPYD